MIQLPGFAKVKVSKSVTVNADKESVWHALLGYQKEEKKFHKKATLSGNTVKIKEEFISVPVVGTAYINYIEWNREPDGRIDYKLQKSKVLTAFEGSWKIDETKDGGAVVLTLTTEIDSWVPMPFKNKILKKVTASGMSKRLAFVKSSAESFKVMN